MHKISNSGKRKWLILAAAIIAAIFACMLLYAMGTKKYRTFSILGDSYSTFAGYMTPSTNKCWYPAGLEGTTGADNDVQNVEETWWRLFSEEYGIELQANNSRTGAPISYDGYGAGTADAKDYSFISRADNLGNPDLIIIFGGTNDDAVNGNLGEYRYSSWKDTDLENFRPAMSCLLWYLKEQYPYSRLLFIANSGLKQEYMESMDQICEHYNVSMLKLEQIDKQNGHPGKAGMVQIKDQLISYLEKQELKH